MNLEFLNWIQIAVLICLAILGLGRALILKTQNIQVFVLDSQMTKIQLFNGFVFVSCFIAWIFESIVHGLSLNYHIQPGILHIVLIQNIGIKIGAVFILVFGLFIYALALYSFRDSWRIGIDRENPGRLITTGIFAWSRNPIYISLDLLVLGVFMLQGYLIFLILSIGIIFSLHFQILQEEKYLIQTYGETYIKYCSKVSRYFNLQVFLR